MNYICTHTDFEEQKRFNDGYTILSCKPLQKQYSAPVEVITENAITPMQYAYAEGYHIWHIWKTKHDEWVGINQYRKYFEDVPMYRTVLPVPRKYNMHEGYAYAHNIHDLLECERIIDEYYPQYRCDYGSLCLSPCNMFVMRWHDFEEYCKFVFGVLDKFNERHGLRTDADVYNFVERRYDQYSHRHSVRYQSRLQGFLLERIGTIFFNTYFNIERRKIHFVGERV